MVVVDDDEGSVAVCREEGEMEYCIGAAARVGSIGEKRERNETRERRRRNGEGMDVDVNVNMNVLRAVIIFIIIVIIIVIINKKIPFNWTPMWMS